MIRDILRMGDRRLLERAKDVEVGAIPELAALLEDLAARGLLGGQKTFEEKPVGGKCCD